MSFAAAAVAHRHVEMSRAELQATVEAAELAVEQAQGSRAKRKAAGASAASRGRGGRGRGKGRGPAAGAASEDAAAATPADSAAAGAAVNAAATVPRPIVGQVWPCASAAWQSSWGAADNYCPLGLCQL